LGHRALFAFKHAHPERLTSLAVVGVFTAFTLPGALCRRAPKNPATTTATRISAWLNYRLRPLDKTQAQRQVRYGPELPFERIAMNQAALASSLKVF
jgi:hypothetical protein